MPSVKNVTTGYGWGQFLALGAAIYMSQFSWIAAGIFFLGYASAAIFLKCPRCGLPTSFRVRTDRKGRERRSRMAHSPSPNYCSRCELDFRAHTLTERFE
jgi:hypothetical protein